MRVDDRVKHKSKPNEPFATVGQHGVVTRVAPSAPGIPAAVFVTWGDDNEWYGTWERPGDLIVMAKPKK